MAKHQCRNAFHGSGARGGCFIEIESDPEHLDASGDPMAIVRVGHSCVIVHDGAMPVSWLAEIINVATLHPGGVAGFLEENGAVTGAGDPDKYGNSYALMCDPPKTI